MCVDYLHTAAARLNGNLQLLNARIARNTPASAIFGDVYTHANAVLSSYRVENKNTQKYENERKKMNK